MLYQHPDLFLKLIARDTAERCRREVEQEQLARRAQTAQPIARRKWGNVFAALFRREHTAPV